MTLFTASKKSFSVAIFRRARIANMPASVHTLRISAPFKKKGQISPTLTTSGDKAYIEWLNESSSYLCY